MTTSNIHPFPTTQAGFRLVPATIGQSPRSRMTVWIECPTWCTVDHEGEPEANLGDIDHEGDVFGIVAPSMADGSSEVEMYARLYSDPTSSDPRMRNAHLMVGNGLTPDAHLTPAEAERWLGELIDFAAGFRKAIHACYAANGDSDADMDEALRRVRGGAA